MVVDPYVEEEPRSKIIDIATSSTDAETAKQAGPEQKHKEESEKVEMQKPQESVVPIMATAKWETANKGANSPNTGHGESAGADKAVRNRPRTRRHTRRKLS